MRTSYYTYNTEGVLRGVSINGGRPRTINFDLDQAGQIVRRRERDNNDSQGDPFEIYYRFGGKQLGYTGNNGTLEVNYLRSVELRTTSPGNGAFRGGATTETAYADFDQSGVTPITSYDQGSDAGGYVVRAGDTLQGIAQQLWGDASLWYKLAQANGLSAGATLSAGQRLNLPSGVQRATFNATTLNPYDPASIIGDTSPTTPTPQARRNKCGIFGAILLVVIAVAVAAIAGPAVIGAPSLTLGGGSIGIGASAVALPTITVAGTGLAGAIGATAAAIVGGALVGAAASIVSQGVGIALGIQSRFDWGAVAMAGLSGGIGGAAGGLIKGAGFGATLARGLVSNLATQGIAVATGLQPKFDWAGVAAAGVSAVAGFGANKAIGGPTKVAGIIAGRAVAASARTIAGAAARSLIDGTSFGDNIMAVLPDAIGQTIGDIVSDALTDRLDAELAENRAAKAAERARARAARFQAVVDAALSAPDSLVPARSWDDIERFSESIQKSLLQVDFSDERKGAAESGVTQPLGYEAENFLLGRIEEQSGYHLASSTLPIDNVSYGELSRRDAFLKDIAKSIGATYFTSFEVGVEGGLIISPPLSTRIYPAKKRSLGSNGKTFSDGRFEPTGTLKYRGGRSHKGIDIPATVGDPVFAIAEGEVVLATPQVKYIPDLKSPIKYGKDKKPVLDKKGHVVHTKTIPVPTGYGYRVIIKHADGTYSHYAHLKEQPSLKNKQSVAGGQIIGRVGNSGNASSSGTHFHFEVFSKLPNGDRYHYNPRIYLQTGRRLRDADK